MGSMTRVMQRLELDEPAASAPAPSNPGTAPAGVEAPRPPDAPDEATVQADLEGIARELDETLAIMDRKEDAPGGAPQPGDRPASVARPGQPHAEAPGANPAPEPANAKQNNKPTSFLAQLFPTAAAKRLLKLRPKVKPGKATGERPPRPAATAASGACAWDAARVHPALIVFHNRLAPVCEQYRALQARLLNMNSDEANVVIAITSSVAREGRTVTALNLGLVLAEGGRRQVAVVEADFRRPSFARLLGIDPAPGLAEALRGQATLEQALRPSPAANLSVLPAGRLGDDQPAELLAQPRFEDTLEALKQKFDHVLIDTPPINAFSDASLLAPRCDGALLVVRVGRVSEAAAQQAVGALRQNQANVLGCVLTRGDGPGAG